MKDATNTIFTVKEVQDLFSIFSMTVRKDCSNLVQHGYLTEIVINKMTRRYINNLENK